MQKKIIEAILSQFSKKSQVIESISELLGVGKDGVYRRMRGDSHFTPDEIAILARKFNISIDSFIWGDAKAVTFSFNDFTRHVTTYEDYITEIYMDTHQMSRIPNVKVYYASSEIPFFYYCLFPELISFKLYNFGFTIWEMEYAKNLKFSFDLIPNKVLDIANEVSRDYNTMPSLELWNINILDNTLAQIDYHFSIGSFENPDDALKLCDILHQWVEHMKKMAEHGHKLSPKLGEKFPGASFELYHNEMVHTNNTIYVETPGLKMVFSTLANPNFIRTVDERMAKYIKDWFDKVLEKSINISTQNSKGREAFFNKLFNKVTAIKNKIQSSID